MSNRTPRTGRRAASAAALAALALAAGTAGPASARPLAAFEAALVRETNAVRADAGLRPLRRVTVLARPARAHSRFLERSGRFQHEGVDGSPFWRRLVAAGFPRHRRMAENIAQVGGCDPAAAADVVRMWLQSPPHRRNLLDPRLRVTGTGAWASSGCGAVYVTADYGG
ncbi:MAG TPA: CAP domain-containing protein [Miltoncostaeaceae bacterium]|nr:CAP domain-containing protein [Miltoncostaeaceae bacterium]